MDIRVECTHCRVLMTSWSAPGSPVRYWQCPFCGHTHSSPYGEVFRAEAGARMLLPRPEAEAPSRPSPEELRWASLKARAQRWFSRLEQEERARGADAPTPPARAPSEPAVATAGRRSTA